MPKPNPNRLLVEGDEEKRLIPELMEKYILWGGPKEPEKWPTMIESSGGIEKMLKPGYIEAELKRGGLQALGIIADANSNPAARWQAIRHRAIQTIPTIPEELPDSGLICQNADGLRFGVWLMPDNGSNGMLETFLQSMIPPNSESLWEFVKCFCEESKNQYGASYRESHHDKALIHAWLSIQDPPGQQLHLAILQNLFTAEVPQAKTFVKWFRDLFRF